MVDETIAEFFAAYLYLSTLEMQVVVVEITSWVCNVCKIYRVGQKT